MTTAVAQLVVKDAQGVTHQLNPLGVQCCLGCQQPFPCSATIAGEQLDLLTVTL